MKAILFCLALIFSVRGQTQELFVFSEPASNMPSHTITPKFAITTGRDAMLHKMTRLTPEIMFGINKKFMVHIGNTFSGKNSLQLKWESVYLYGKYRFLSIDDVHRHFRMAVFAQGTYSRNTSNAQEVSIQGDRSGAQLGVIATQLINRLAISGSFSHIRADNNGGFNTADRTNKAFNYSLSTGFLVLPATYTSYKQLNMNLYAELLGQRATNFENYYTDFATAVQFIFNSNTKLNLGYRFALRSTITRPMVKTYLVSLEHTFYNAFKKRKG
jgi:hypothetical protein